MNTLVNLKTYNTRLEASVDKSYLLTYGMETYIEADDLGGTRPFPFQPNASGVLLKVSEKDYKKAKELLEKVTSN